ncbi:MAG TPA: deoxyguanosinetriphosphate triphosphohydrolase [Candidatus Omnitrophota bacterium]|nr:deoxyguanosinetriphosphate triphosphohydrolase [Candidatus Omnitrophota bacterium]HPT07641.1 deoxyguanosinetriphosphate triphosphohydrolase [Candidatus Omnitrophota bacterium]
MINQAQIKKYEDTFLAPYAMKSYLSKGRRYKETEHAYRSVYQRDRDRIIHSTAFRKLEYKTQVFVNHEGDYYRTRLTHTIEVGQIARTLAFSMRLNIDLTEAVALAHDLGHTAFGHSGEEALDTLMAHEGGFNHNIHSLKVVDELEERYPDFPGLNLTWEVREGIIKHSSAFDKAGRLKEFAPGQMPTFETQIVDIADEIAYDNHDLDDGLTSGLLQQKDLEKLDIWKKVTGIISKQYNNLDPDRKKYLIIRRLIDMQVTDLIQETEKNLQKLNPSSYLDIKKRDTKIVAFSPAMQDLRNPLRALLLEKLYHHYRVVRMSNKAKRFITELFEEYVNKPEGLPFEVQKRIKTDGLRRAVCYYIAGMTDRYALDEYKKLFEPYEKV